MPNKIVMENRLPGTSQSEWDLSNAPTAGDPTIQGFASPMSVNLGETVDFKVDTTAPSYHINIYRLGYYDGDGARRITSIAISAPGSQPDPLTEKVMGQVDLVDCGNWSISASWHVPEDATSGVYIAKLVRDDTGGNSHMVFVVRDDWGGSALLFQTSDTTWHAYNAYQRSSTRSDLIRGNCLYQGPFGGVPYTHAYKVSYNRPLVTREGLPGDMGTHHTCACFLFANEYPMIRWLERNGYDVSYFTGVDSDRHGELIRQHRVFLSVGHDEYWSADQRKNVEAARDAGCISPSSVAMKSTGRRAGRVALMNHIPRIVLWCATRKR